MLPRLSWSRAASPVTAGATLPLVESPSSPDGVEALEHLERAEAPALILTDINMPRMNGIALVAAIRKIDRLRYVPIVMLTSSSEEPDLLASYERGANSYVLKPVRFSDFTELMDRLGMYWLVLNEAPNRDSRPA